MRKWARGNHTPGGHIVLVTCHRHERQRPALVESSRVRVRVCASREEERLCQIRGQHRAASRPLSCFHMSVLHSCYISSTYILIKFGTPRYSVGQLSRAMGRPTPVLYDSALRVVHYLHRTRDIGLRVTRRPRGPSTGTQTPTGPCVTQHSTSGWVFILNQAAISWGSKKQKSVALSSCEAEIVAASEASKEAVYLRNLAAELGYDQTDPTDLHMDNRSAIDVAYNPEHHTQMKHVDRRHFYVRELVEDHVIRCPFVSTDDNWADFFTKALPPRK